MPDDRSVRLPSTDGVSVALHDLGGDGPNVLVAHATGFCAGPYRPLAAGLARAGCHVWALDFRAHGDSPRPAGEITWTGMADDVLAVVDHLGAGPVPAFGHSMGGAALALAELRRPGTLSRGVLFEPIIIPEAWRGGAADNPLAAAARKRRPGFASREAALARFAARPPLDVFRADALWGYVDQGLEEQPDGTVVLKCTPDDEADTYLASGKPEIAQVGAVDVPMLVLLGGRDPGPGPADFAPAVADAMPQGRAQRYPHLGHFGPFQDPDTVAADAATFLLA